MTQKEQELRLDVFRSMVAGLAQDELGLLLLACSEELAFLHKDHWNNGVYMENWLWHNNASVTSYNVTRIDKSSTALRPFGAPDL